MTTNANSKVVVLPLARTTRTHRNTNLCRQMSSVITLSNLDAVDTFTQLNEKCCIYYTATWCGPCRAVKPVYQALSATYRGTVALGTVDVDHASDAAAAAEISAVPTITLYHHNAVVKTFSGADEAQLRTSLTELAAAK